MIEVFFTLNGEQQRKVHRCETAKELFDFMQSYKDRVLKIWPEAKDIKLGEYLSNINEY